MKTIFRSTLAALLSALCLLGMTACGTSTESNVWDTALYTENTTLVDGAVTLTVDVTADDRTVTFTVLTDETTVGNALLEHGLIEGEDSTYGLYVKKVNGMLADYDVDQTYWAFYIDGDYAMTGVEQTDITEGATYQLVRAK